jgi:hypothetical protein
MQPPITFVCEFCGARHEVPHDLSHVEAFRAEAILGGGLPKGWTWIAIGPTTAGLEDGAQLACVRCMAEVVVTMSRRSRVRVTNAR